MQIEQFSAFRASFSVGLLWLISSLGFGCSGDDGVTPGGSTFDTNASGGDSGEDIDGSILDSFTQNDTSTGQGGTGNDSGQGGSGGQQTDAASNPDQLSSEDAIPDINFHFDSVVTDSELNADTSCAGELIEAPPTPLDIYIMLDRSGSMVEPGYQWGFKNHKLWISGGDCNYNSSTPPLNSRWCASVYSLAGYFQSPSAKGNKVALQFYPIEGKEDLNNCADTAETGLANPWVTYTQLPGGANLLVNALNKADPMGDNTPTRAALHGLAKYTISKKDPTGKRKSIAILITDGIPNSCGETWPATNVSKIKDAKATAEIPKKLFHDHSIPTYVVGMNGADFAVLEVIAKDAGVKDHTTYCGKAPPCYSYDVKKGEANVFINVLKEIQKNAIGCSYPLPVSSSGVVDPNKIKVQYTLSGHKPVGLDRVKDSSQCNNHSWYLNSETPAKIELCPEVCDKVQKDDDAKVQVLAGCEGS